MARRNKQTSFGTSAALTARQWRLADHDERRRMIVQSALDLLVFEGLPAVTMRRVAAHLGVGAMTLYTYVDGQDQLHMAMMRRGFELLHEGCQRQHDAHPGDSWRSSARHYLRFAQENPRLYELMFSTPQPRRTDAQIMSGGLQPLLERIRADFDALGMTGRKLDRAALAAAGRYWITLHGLASLAIAGRLHVLQTDLDDLLEDLLKRVAPTPISRCPPSRIPRPQSTTPPKPGPESSKGRGSIAR